MELFDPNFFDEKAASSRAEKAAPPNRVFLLGMMGAGKTTVGNRLAERLGWAFLDLDEAIEKGAGRSVAEIFDQKGEAHFRRLEQNALRQTFLETKIVVATGGGAPCFFDNVLEMSRHGATVWLAVGSTVLAERLWPERAKRPLLAALEKAEFEPFLLKILQNRLPFYQKAMFAVAAESPPATVAEAISEAIFG